MPRFRRRFLSIGGRLSPRNYLTYSLLLVLIVAGLLYAGTWALALIARETRLEPGDPGFQAIMGVGLAGIGAFALWSMVAMAAKRARDAHLATLGFKTGLPAIVLLDHFGAARLTDERLAGPLAQFTPFAAFALAAVFLFLVLAPRAPIAPLHGERGPSGLVDGETDLVPLYG